MKKLMFFLGVISLQVTTAQEIKFGVKGGLNIANLTGEITEGKKDPRIGFHAGGIAEIKLSDKFAIQPEVLFSTQGTRSKEVRTFGGDKYEIKALSMLNYINVPVLAKYFITERFSIEVGPQIGFLVSAKDRYEMTGSGETEKETKKTIKNYKTVDFGLSFGLGYALESGIFFQGRYNLGLTDIAKDNKGKAIKNSVFQVSTGYRF